MRLSRQPAPGPSGLGALAGACLLSLAACAPGRSAGSHADYRGWLLPEPQPKVEFTLSDTEGRAFDFVRETDGYVTLLFFGYTHCPDVCPIHMANIGAVLKDFPYDLRQQFKVIFVTTDPERDTAERLRSWLDNFDRSFIGLHGSPEQVNEIQIAFGLPAAVKQGTEDGGYLVGHSARVLVFTRDNLAHIAYPFGTRQADWAHDLPRLSDEQWGAG